MRDFITEYNTDSETSDNKRIADDDNQIIKLCSDYHDKYWQKNIYNLRSGILFVHGNHFKSFVIKNNQCIIINSISPSRH